MPEDYGWGKWELETLPLIPQEFKLFPLKGYSGQIKLLKKLICRDDVTEIINACDAGREGECIFRYIYNYFGCKKPTKRFWISSLTDESIKQGMKNLLDGKEKDNLFAAGFTRAKADWILGMSLSRLYSIVNDDSHKVGRVKTPVLNIVVNRDEAIAAFTKRPFYKVVLENGAECENVFDTAEQAEAVRAKCSGKIAVVSSSKTEQKKENRPLLHSLTSLQQEANDVYGMTAADTLKSAQSLYEKKLLTYPRTDSSYLSDDMIPLVESIVKCLAGYDGERVQRLQEQGLIIDKRIIDNSKISDHHAIIPTNLIGRLDDEKLDDNEQRIVKLVINRFLCAVDKPYIYSETKYEFLVEDEIFKLTVKTPIEWGWKQYKLSEPAELDEDTDKVLSVLYSENATFTADNIEVKQGETKPPKHFTDDTCWIDPLTGIVYPYPLAIGTRYKTLDLLPTLRSMAIKTTFPGKLILPVQTDWVSCPSKSFSYFLWELDFSRNDFQIDKADKKELVFNLLSHSFSYKYCSNKSATFDCLLNALENCNCYRLSGNNLSVLPSLLETIK